MRVRTAVLALAALAGLSLGGAPAPEAPAPPVERAGRVLRIVDGDTLHIDGEPRALRLWGLDAPERDTAEGPAAAAALAELAAGRHLACRIRDVDAYGRRVGQCRLPDGRDLAEAMIATGTAREFCWFSGNHYGTC